MKPLLGAALLASVLLLSGCHIKSDGPHRFNAEPTSMQYHRSGGRNG